jgi:hypothetical protein
MIKSISLALCILTTSALADAVKRPAPAGCPTVVKTSLGNAFPGSKLGTCKAEHENGRDQFEVKLTKADGNAVEVDIGADGKILQIEEKVALDKVPAAVMKAFGARYPQAKAEAAEKQTPATGAATYELAFTLDSVRKEVTFAEDGKFVDAE